MNDTTKNILKKACWIIITFLILELLLLSALEAVSVLTEYRLNISADLIFSELGTMFQNIFSVINNYWQERNPLFIIGTIAILIYTLILHKGKFKKEGWETYENNAYHGSAHWGKNNEIVDKKNFISKTDKDIEKEFLNSLERSKNQ